MDYQKICQSLFKDLSERTKEVIFRRFALNGGERATLEAIGEDFGLTRERVRQIEEDGLRRIKKSPQFANLEKIFQKFRKYFASQGDFKKEDILFQVFNSQPNSSNWVFFLLNLDGSFLRFIGDKELHNFWVKNPKIILRVKKIVKEVKKILEKERKSLTFKEISQKIPKNWRLLRSSLEVSKEIIFLSDGRFVLKTWPEINPRGVKDLAYLIFKKIQKPLHFTEITKLIDEFFKQKSPQLAPLTIIQAAANLNKKTKPFGKFRLGGEPSRTTNPQTVHNELIRDPRFVLVGRGTYALAEWGYKPGVVKDVISGTLKEAKKPLSREEILKKVLSQRLVKENTVLLNLHNKDYFLRTEDGKYTIREA